MTDCFQEGRQKAVGIIDTGGGAREKKNERYEDLKHVCKSLRKSKLLLLL